MGYKPHFIKWKFNDNEERLFYYILCDDEYDVGSFDYRINLYNVTRQAVLTAIENEFGFDPLIYPPFLNNVDSVNYDSVTNLESLCPTATIPEDFNRSIDVEVGSDTYNFRFYIDSYTANFQAKYNNIWAGVISAGYTTSRSDNNHRASAVYPVFKASDINDPTTILNKNPMMLAVGCQNDYDTQTMEYYYVCNFQWRDSGGVSGYVQNFINAIKGTPEIIPPSPSDDPYGPDSGGGYSGSGGGPAPSGGTGTTGNGGLHDDTSDPINTPSLPSDVAISSGLFTAYNPSAGQLVTFANKLWNADPTTIGDLFRLLFGGDAFNAIIGLHLIPVAPSTGSSQHIMLGNWDSEASAPVINSQYKQVEFGSLLLPEYWGNCIDYSPYTKVQLALPYIGIVDVDADDVIGSTNTLTYNIDVLSGAICATLHVQKLNLSSVIYQWSGSCAVSLPTTGANYNSIMGAVAGVAASGAGVAAFAGSALGAALPAAAVAGIGMATMAGSAASTYGSTKGKVQKSGAFGANSGALGIMTPYFILTRPVQSVPSTWQQDKGYPANISAQLGTLTGYTEVSEIDLVGIWGTEAEKNEIKALLKGGVIF